VNLTIDIGNTRIKAGFFNHHSLDCSFVFNTTDELIQSTEFQSLLKNVEFVILSNVAKTEVVDYIKKLILPTAKVFSATTRDEVAFTIDYENKESLGTDRIAAVWGTIAEFLNDTMIIIDVGTCIKYNVVINKTFVGGAISPGLLMRYKAMHYYTGKLPLLEPLKEGKVNVIGKNTFENIHSGVINGCVYEIERFIDELENQLNTAQSHFYHLKMREGCGGRRSRHCLAFGRNVIARVSARSDLFKFNMKHLRLLHYVRNDDKARIAEAKAKPEAARPERSGTATSEGHAQNTKNNEIKIVLTGGDAIFFANLLKRKVLLRPYLTLSGLNEWLEYKKQSLSDS
jgi:type III pantothenate kinase